MNDSKIRSLTSEDSFEDWILVEDSENPSSTKVTSTSSTNMNINNKTFSDNESVRSSTSSSSSSSSNSNNRKGTTISFMVKEKSNETVPTPILPTITTTTTITTNTSNNNVSDIQRRTQRIMLTHSDDSLSHILSDTPKRHWFEYHSSSSIDSDEPEVSSRVLLRDHTRSCANAAAEIFSQLFEEGEENKEEEEEEEEGKYEINKSNTTVNNTNNKVTTLLPSSALPFSSISNTEDSYNNINLSPTKDELSSFMNSNYFISFIKQIINYMDLGRRTVIPCWTFIYHKLQLRDSIDVCLCIATVACMVFCISFIREISFETYNSFSIGGFISKGASWVKFLMFGVGPVLRLGETLFFHNIHYPSDKKIISFSHNEKGEESKEEEEEEEEEEKKQEKENNEENKIELFLDQLKIIITYLVQSFVFVEETNKYDSMNIKLQDDKMLDTESNNNNNSPDKELENLHQSKIRVWSLVFLCVSGGIMPQYVLFYSY